MNESYGSVNSHGLWACANINNPYKVGDGSIFIPDFPRFVMNDDVQGLVTIFFFPSTLKTTREESKMSNFHTTLFQNSFVLVS
jgi:hypothetical protein